MKFTLEIKLDNDAMQTGNDVANALEEVATAVRFGRRDGMIRDANGHTVGDWEVA